VADRELVGVSGKGGKPVKRYTVRLAPEQDEDGEYYAVEVDECLGLIEAGRSVEEALAKAGTAIVEWEGGFAV